MTDKGFWFIRNRETGKIVTIEELEEKAGRPFIATQSFCEFMLGFLPDVYEVARFPLEVNTTILDVPYLSQWGVGADERTGDCGPACIAMLAHYLSDYRPTVDQAAKACGQPLPPDPGQKYTSHSQLRKGAAAYGIKIDTRGPYTDPPLPKLSVDLLKSQIDDGKPSIALIHYGVLRDLTIQNPDIVHNQDSGSPAHWVLFVGYDDENVYINDPDFWGTRAADGKLRRIPEDMFRRSLETPSPGNNYGEQGLIIV